MAIHGLGRVPRRLGLTAADELYTLGIVARPQPRAAAPTSDGSVERRSSYDEACGATAWAPPRRELLWASSTTESS